MIYLDNNASTPLDPRVSGVYLDALNSDFGNASNESHDYGKRAAHRVDLSRELIAKYLDRDQREIIFTSGATEALSLAILGVPVDKPNILISAIEHSAVSEAARLRASKNNGQVFVAPVKASGEIDIQKWEELLNENVGLAIAIAVNNETGVVAPIQEISRVARAKNVVLIGDTTQALGKLATANWSNDFDVLCISSHKISGPKGVGVLVLPRELQKNFESVLPGGGQQKSIRGGTFNVPGIVAIAEAIKNAVEDQVELEVHYRDLANAFTQKLQELEIDFEINGSRAVKVPNTLSVHLPGIDTEELILKNQLVAISMGSACHAGFDTPSHVLIAMGLSRKHCDQSFRVSFGRQNTKQEAVEAASSIAETVKQILEGK